MGFDTHTRGRLGCRRNPLRASRPAMVCARLALSADALDPFGKIPEFKFCAVKVEKVTAQAEVQSTVSHSELSLL